MSCVRMSGSTFCMSRSKFVAPSCDWRKSSCRKTDLFSSTQLTGSLSLYIFTRRSCSVASSSFSASPSSSDSNLKPSVLIPIFSCAKLANSRYVLLFSADQRAVSRLIVCSDHDVMQSFHTHIDNCYKKTRFNSC